jgi:DHA1 family multidrug resistance protein-like MFS transporter
VQRSSAYPYWRRNLVILGGGCFVAQIAFSIVIAFLPQYLVSLGLRVNQGFWSGMAISVASLTYAAMAPVWGALADRFGKRVMMLRSGLGIAAVYLLTGLARDHLQVFFLRAIVGLLSGYIPSAIMLIACNTPEAHLGFALGAIQTAISLGTIVGPLVGGAVAEVAGLRGTLFASAGFIFAATVLPLGLVREEILCQERPTRVQAGVRQAWSDLRLRRLFLALFLAQAALLTVQPTLPLWIASLVQARVALVTGTVYSLLGVSMALGAVLVGRRVSRWGAERVLRGSFLAAAALFVLQGLAPSVPALAGFRFLSGFAVAGLTVAGNLLVAQTAPPENRGMAFGVLNALTAIGGVAGPLLGGVMGDQLGLASPFFGSAVLFALAAAGWWPRHEGG